MTASTDAGDSTGDKDGTQQRPRNRKESLIIETKVNSSGFYPRKFLVIF